jgi:hypothetical protein
MAHFAFLDDAGTVTEVIVGNDEGGGIDWETYYGDIRGQRCLRTSYNTQAGLHLAGGVPFRGNYAAIGMVYSDSLDAFITPRPGDGWELDAATFTWTETA